MPIPPRLLDSVLIMEKWIVCAIFLSLAPQQRVRACYDTVLQGWQCGSNHTTFVCMHAWAICRTGRSYQLGVVSCTRNGVAN